MGQARANIASDYTRSIDTFNRGWHNKQINLFEADLKALAPCWNAYIILFDYN